MLVFPLQRKVYIGQVNLDLTRQEFNLLQYMVINEGIVLTYEQIYCFIWNDECDSSPYTLIKGLIKRLRGKIAATGGGHITILNKWGVGYFLPKCIESSPAPNWLR